MIRIPGDGIEPLLTLLGQHIYEIYLNTIISISIFLNDANVGMTGDEVKADQDKEQLENSDHHGTGSRGKKHQANA